MIRRTVISLFAAIFLSVPAVSVELPVLNNDLDGDIEGAILMERVPGARRADCPAGMVTIENKFCIDQFEYPNIEGQKPLSYATREKAEEMCVMEGKRLCSVQEWQAACKGPEKWKYPYGPEYRKGVCNDATVEDGPRIYPAGSFERCVSGYGVYDISGNLWEWVDNIYDNGETAGIQGGSAASEDKDSLACTTLSADMIDEAYMYDGFRCCLDYPGTRTSFRSRASRMSSIIASSPLVSRPVPSSPEGGYFGAEYFNLDNIMDTDSYNASVNVKGMALTAGIKFDKGRLDYTRIQYSIDQRNYGTTGSIDDAANIIHAAVALTSVKSVVPGFTELTVGFRWLDSEGGKAFETYFLSELKLERVSIIPVVNFLDRSNRTNRLGFGLDVRYHASENLDLLANYNSADIFKNAVSDFIVPVTSLASSYDTSDLKQYAASMGVSYKMFSGDGRLYFMVYDIGDLDAPMGGTVINF